MHALLHIYNKMGGGKKKLREGGKMKRMERVERRDMRERAREREGERVDTETEGSWLLMTRR